MDKALTSATAATVEFSDVFIPLASAVVGGALSWYAAVQVQSTYQKKYRLLEQLESELILLQREGADYWFRRFEPGERAILEVKIKSRLMVVSIWANRLDSESAPDSVAELVEISTGGCFEMQDDAWEPDHERPYLLTVAVAELMSKLQ